MRNGAFVDLNQYIQLGSDLPTLKPGTNQITFDNTINELEITPRWWEL
jgi:phage-related protein